MAQGRITFVALISRRRHPDLLPIRSRHNNRPPHPHHCLQGLWLLGQPSPNFARLVTSAGNLNHEPETPSIPTDFTVRRDSILTKSPKGCADPVAEVSDRYSVGKPSHHSVASSARSIAGKSTWSMVTHFDMGPNASDSEASTRRNWTSRTDKRPDCG